MSLKDKLFFKKEKVVEQAPALDKEAYDKSFVLGALDVYSLPDSDDCMVMGRVRGTIRKGDAVYVSNVGSEEDSIFLTTVVSLETSPGVSAEEATDCAVGIRLEKGMKHKVKNASVLYARESSMEEVHNEYINALGDIYVGRKKLELSKQDIEELSITDCAEIFRLFSWFHSNVVKQESEEAKKANREKLDGLGALLCKKILDADFIYCVFSKRTGEPYLFSKTIDQKDGTYRCTPPDIMLLTQAYKSALSVHFPEDAFEIRKIEKGEDGKGIYNFLGSTFYLNGACGVRVLSEYTTIDAGMLVPAPDYSNVKPQDIPVTNPDVVRWMLLIGQMGEPDNADKELIYKLYYRFLTRELVKARFLVPMKTDKPIPAADKEGKTVLQKDVQMQLATIKGKQEKPAVRMYTDWKRLRMEFDKQWGGMVQPIEGMIHSFDCAINITQYPKAGCYISGDMFESIKKETESTIEG